MRPRLLTSLVLTLSLTPMIAAAAMSTMSSSCGKTGARDIARCNTDSIKKWAEEERAFNAEQDKKHTEWHQVHDLMGVTTEYEKLHRAYHEEMKRLNQSFDLRLQQEKKALAGQTKRKMSAPMARPVTARPGGSSARLEEGMKRCTAKFKSEQEIRFCMRPYVRLLDTHGRTTTK